MILYHYCTTHTFHSIVQNESFRLSALTQSNDYQEGRLVADAVERLAKTDGLKQEELARLQQDVSSMETSVEGLAFCLSRKGDLLSQWRGYAGNGTGVSIGIDSFYLKELCKLGPSEERPRMHLKKILYKISDHDKAISAAYGEVKAKLSTGEWNKIKGMSLYDRALGKRNADSVKAELKANLELSRTSIAFIEHLFLLKSYAFKEENELRLLSLFPRSRSSNLEYRCTDSQIIPFRTCKLEKLNHKSITHVILGPKHQTPKAVVASFLEQCGFGQVIVSNSTASYR